MKLKAIAAAAALMMLCTVTAYADGISIDYDFDNGKMIISGDAGGKSGVYVSVVLTNNDNGRPYLVDQTVTNSNGECEFIIDIGLLDNGTYHADVHIGSEEYSAEKYFNTSLVPKKTEQSSGSGGGGGSSSGSSGSKYVPAVEIPDMSSRSTTAEEKGFDDVPKQHWAYAAVSSLYAKGIVSGVGDNRFGAEDYLTREQFAKLLIEVMKLDLVDDDIEHTDVDKDSWSYPYLVAVYKYGIMEGYSDDILGVQDNILRKDIAVLVDRALEVKSLSLGGEEKTIPDIEDVSDYAKDSVRRLYAAGIINGMEDGSFMPDEYVTRAQAAVILDKLMKSIGG